MEPTLFVISTIECHFIAQYLLNAQESSKDGQNRPNFSSRFSPKGAFTNDVIILGGRGSGKDDVTFLI